MRPVVLDFDASVGRVPGALHVALESWQDALRFACTRRQLQHFRDTVLSRLPEAHGTVLLGSGDFHHLSALLIERLAQARPPGERFPVFVFDNHPDNMFFPFGLHCASWVRRVASLPQVSHVHVLGISSPDVGLGHAWENDWRPLRRGQLTYWCLDVDVRWAARLGQAAAFRSFADADALLQAFLQEQADSGPCYVSIDKDVLSAATVRTNWDQGRLEPHHLLRAIQSLRGRILGSDICGEVSCWRYTSRWKRWLSAMDHQPPVNRSELASLQAQQQAVNRELLAALAASHA